MTAVSSEKGPSSSGSPSKSLSLPASAWTQLSISCATRLVYSRWASDNFRVFHTPGPFYRLPFKFRSVPTAAKGERLCPAHSQMCSRNIRADDDAQCSDLKDQTLHIRIAAVDAPENAHFGNPAQPFAKESWDWMKKLLTNKRVKVQLIRKDQYQRVVSAQTLAYAIESSHRVVITHMTQPYLYIPLSLDLANSPWDFKTDCTTDFSPGWRAVPPSTLTPRQVHTNHDAATWYGRSL